MLTIIIMAILLGLASFLFMIRFSPPPYSLFWRVGCIVGWSAAGAGIGVAFALIAAGIAGYAGQFDCYTVSIIQLQDLSGSTGTTGSYLYVNQQYSYDYFINLGDHFEHRNTPGRQGRVFEDNPEKPYVVNMEPRPGKVLSWFILSTGDVYCSTDFHIPKGSIVNGYKLGGP